MKKKLYVLSIVILALSLQFCGHHFYTNPVFMEKAADHRIIAVLPFEMVFTGKQPKKLTIEQIREIEVAESIAFQNSLYHALLNQKNRYKNPLLIDVLSVRKTNRLLKSNDIDVRESWDMSSEELARLLKVDAVVRTRVIKKRYMSNLASFGIEVGNIVLNTLLDDSPLALFFGNPTKKIKAQCYLHNGVDGIELWGTTIVDEINWMHEANRIIDGINRYLARKFPYR
ncbi:MAG: hypothetical protein GY765_26740 [bacterium]|nr:hypothetical protein [bacterium]